MKLYKRFFFSRGAEQRSLASREIDNILRREKNDDHATLGIEISRKDRKVGIAHLTYRQISLIFEYLDADTIKFLHKNSKDIQSFKNNLNEKNVRFVRFHGTKHCHLPSYLKIPLYRAVSNNLRAFE